MKMALDDDKRAPGGTRAKVEFDVDLGSYEKYYLSKFENISSGGAFVRTRELQAVGTMVDLRFKLPNDRNLIQAKAEVIWTYNQAGQGEPNSSGMGVKFIEIEEKDRHKIANFVAQFVRD